MTPTDPPTPPTGTPTDTTHACPGGCGARVRAGWYACRPCWFRLPKQLRDDIGFHWQMRNYSAHRAAMTAAGAWLRDNPREGGTAP